MGVGIQYLKEGRNSEFVRSSFQSSYFIFGAIEDNHRQGKRQMPRNSGWCRAVIDLVFIWNKFNSLLHFSETELWRKFIHFSLPSVVVLTPLEPYLPIIPVARPIGFLFKTVTKAKNLLWGPLLSLTGSKYPIWIKKGSKHDIKNQLFISSQTLARIELFVK